MNYSYGDGLDPCHTLSDGGYDARFYLIKDPAGLAFGHVDVFEGTAHKCRIVLAGRTDGQCTVKALEEKCREWIKARERGDAFGRTNFGQP